MDIQYVIFVIGYDYAIKFEKMELACDEAYKLAYKIANYYKDYCRKYQIDEYYDSLHDFLEAVSFEKIWGGIK